MEERDFFDERQETRKATMTCPHCQQSAEYELGWFIRTKKKQLLGRADERYRGGPDKPFTPDELHAKFSDCAQLTMAAPRIARAIGQIEAVDRLKDIGELVRALA